jgi:transcriptional antiterminator NusG
MTKEKQNEKDPVSETTEEEPQSQKKWYAVHVLSGHERKVKAYLENEIKAADFEERISNVLIPSEEVTEMREGKKRTRDKVFFPGYMLIEMVFDRDTQHLVLSTPGVTNFVGPKNKPQPLREEEIDRILGRVEESKAREVVEVPFSVGDPIRVIDGPFSEFTGFVQEVNEEKKKVKVLVSIFGRPTPVELDFLQVELEK